jgi:prepilin-type N-terminal cleavage/methylation domain-containing protein
MKKQQSGFTLIELVVVFVILGILAATAIPRFTDVTDEARTAVANGIVGAIQSAAVIQYASNNGTASTGNQIMAQVLCDTDETVTVSINGSGAEGITCNGTAVTTAGQACDATDLTLANTVVVNVGGQASDTRNIPAGLCSG